MAESTSDTNQPNIQGVGEDPLLYWTKVFVRFLQLVFAANDKGNYKWEPDDKLTDVVITAAPQIAPEVVNKGPAVLVERGGLQFTNLAMDQLHKRSQSNGRTRVHSDLASSSVTIHCISRESIEAGRIAWNVMMTIRRFKRSLNRMGIHRVGEDLAMGKPSPPGALVGPQSTDAVVVSVEVPFLYQDTWYVEPHDKTLLRGIDLALTSQIKNPAVGGGKLRPPQYNGKTLSVDNTVSLTSRVRVTGATTPKPRK